MNPPGKGGVPAVRLVRGLRSAFPWEYYRLHLSDDAVHELRGIVLEGAALAAKTLASRKGAGRG